MLKQKWWQRCVFSEKKLYNGVKTICFYSLLRYWFIEQYNKLTNENEVQMNGIDHWINKWSRKLINTKKFWAKGAISLSHFVNLRRKGLIWAVSNELRNLQPVRQRRCMYWAIAFSLNKLCQIHGIGTKSKSSMVTLDRSSESIGPLWRRRISTIVALFNPMTSKSPP